MSLFSNNSINCAKCGEIFTMEVVGSINADRRPDLREAILADSFQDSTCPSCGNASRLEPSFTYVDAGRGQWILSMPAREMPAYRAAEAQAASLFARSYGADAPKSAQEVGVSLVPRLTFGWPAAREKLLIRELGLDDTVVEMVKLDLLRRVADAPLAPGVEQRLVGMENERMRFVWLGAADEGVLSDVSVGREIYDVIAADTTGWGEIRELLTDGYFVDMQKTYMGDGSPA